MRGKLKKKDFFENPQTRGVRASAGSIIFTFLFIYLFIFARRLPHPIIIEGMPPDAGGNDNVLPGGSPVVAGSMGFMDAVDG